MGLKLVAGAGFASSEIGEMHENDNKSTSSVVVTAALAKKLFPKGSAVGQVIYIVGDSPVRIVGVVERAQTPWPAQDWGAAWSEYATFVPLQFVNNGLNYMVRTKPGQQAQVMHGVQDRLFGVTRQRVIDHVQPFTETRTSAYRTQQSESWLLGAVWRTAAGDYGSRNDRVDHVLGGAAAPADRHAPGAGCAARRHPALLPHRESGHRRHGRAAGRRRWTWREPVDGHPSGDRAHESDVHWHRRGYCAGLEPARGAVAGVPRRLHSAIAGNPRTVGTGSIVAGYYLHLAIRCLRRNLALTALIIAAVGVGIGATMTVFTVLLAMSGDPIPAKSSQLFAVQIDAWGPASRKSTGPSAPSENRLPDLLTYQDAVAFMRAHAAGRQAAMYGTGQVFFPAKGGTLPARRTSHLPRPLCDVPGAFPFRSAVDLAG